MFDQFNMVAIVLAHIAGIPAEETALGLAPALAVAGALGLRRGLRSALGRRAPDPYPAGAPHGGAAPKASESRRGERR